MGAYYWVAFDMGPIPTENQFHCQTLVACRCTTPATERALANCHRFHRIWARASKSPELLSIADPARAGPRTHRPLHQHRSGGGHHPTAACWHVCHRGWQTWMDRSVPLLIPFMCNSLNFLMFNLGNESAKLRQNEISKIRLIFKFVWPPKESIRKCVHNEFHVKGARSRRTHQMAPSSLGNEIPWHREV